MSGVNGRLKAKGKQGCVHFDTLFPASTSSVLAEGSLELTVDRKLQCLAKLDSGGTGAKVLSKDGVALMLADDAGAQVYDVFNASKEPDSRAEKKGAGKVSHAGATEQR